MADTTTTTRQPPINNSTTIKVTVATTTTTAPNHPTLPTASAIAATAANANSTRKWGPHSRNNHQPCVSTDEICSALDTLKPPSSPPKPINSNTTSPPHTFAQKTTCSCTKIGVMQLFHEMKQEFATVPDYLVCQYVTDNCHNRPALLESLKLEAQRYPGSVQAYPQALRNQNQNQNHTTTNNSNNYLNCNSTFPVNKPNNQLTNAHQYRPAPEQSQQQKHEQTNPNIPPKLLNDTHRSCDATTTTLTSNPNYSTVMANKPPTSITKPPPHYSPPSAPSVPLGRRPGVRFNNFLLQNNATTTTTTTQTTTTPISNTTTTNKPKSINNEIFDPAGIKTKTTTTTQQHIENQTQDNFNLSSRLHNDNISETKSDTNRTNPAGVLPKPTIDNTKPKVPQRPSTLNLLSSSLESTPPFNLIARSTQVNNNNNNHHPLPTLPQHRTVNSSPQAPSITQPHSSAIGQPTRIAPLPPRPKNNTPVDSPLNVSVNVTVSPISGPLVSQRNNNNNNHNNVRHTSAITVQPELWPFSPSLPPSGVNSSSVNASPLRSYTSVQFKLRPPAAAVANSSVTSSNSQPTPIDISAGPSLLTYSSASFDARMGLESHLQITVDGGGNGSISATRTRPRHCYTTPSDMETTTSSSSDDLRMARSVSAVRTQSSNNRPTQLDEAEIVHRQILCKKRLALELENDRKRLARMQHEIKTLSAPIPAGGSTQLMVDIQRLQNSCKQMVQMVEEAGPYVLGETNEAVYREILSSQTMRHDQLRSGPLLPSQSPSSASTPATPNTFAFYPSTAATPANNMSSHYFNRLPNWHLIQQQQQQQLQQQQQQQQHPAELQPWACNMCTFQNHPLMNKCEQCEMPLLTTSGTVPTQTAPHSSIAPSHSLLLTPPQSLSLSTQPAASPAVSTAATATAAAPGPIFSALSSVYGPPTPIQHALPLRPAPPPPSQMRQANNYSPPYPTAAHDLPMRDHNPS